MLFYDRIKELKNKIYNINKNRFIKELKLPIALIDFWGYSESTEEDFIDFDDDVKDEFATFNHLSKDVFVCLIDAIDLLITGSWANAASLLRLSLETIGVIDFGNTFKRFNDIRTRYVFGIKEPIFKGDKVFNALRDLDKKQGINSRVRNWAFLSKYASHASSSRMQTNFSVIDGKQTPTLGYKIIDDNNFPGGHIRQFNLISAYYINVAITFYSKRNFKDKDELEKIRNKFSQYFLKANNTPQ